MTRVCFPIPTSSQIPPATRCDPVPCQNVDQISPNGSHYRRCFAFYQPTGKSDALVIQMVFYYYKKKKKTMKVPCIWWALKRFLRQFDWEVFRCRFSFSPIPVLNLLSVRVSFFSNYVKILCQSKKRADFCKQSNTNI